MGLAEGANPAKSISGHKKNLLKMYFTTATDYVIMYQEN